MEFLVVAVIIFLIVWLKKGNHKKQAQKRGVEGERKVARKLSKCDTKTSRLLNDVVFLDEKGESYQIDHIFINENGIWIIETKNWAGRIYGTDEQKEWTQVLAYGKEKNRMYSPVKQNLTHAFKVQKILKGRVPILPLVVFVSADISNVKSGYVCDIDNLPRMVRRNYGFHLTPQEIEQYYQTLVYYQSQCCISSEEHSRKREQKQKGLKRGICPNCSGKLVERVGQNGAFYGCSNYPKCHFTIKKQ